MYLPRDTSKPSPYRGEGAPEGADEGAAVQPASLVHTLIRHGFAVPPSPCEGEGLIAMCIKENL